MFTIFAYHSSERCQNFAFETFPDSCLIHEIVYPDMYVRESITLSSLKLRIIYYSKFTILMKLWQEQYLKRENQNVT